MVMMLKSKIMIFQSKDVHLLCDWDPNERIRWLL